MQDAIILYENGKAIGGEGHPTNASDITFDNTGTDLVSENVEDAIKEAYGKSAKSADLTSISESGTTASQAISAGTYFYLDGTLVRAKTAIANGAAFTLNTNYEVISGGLNSVRPHRFDISFGNVTANTEYYKLLSDITGGEITNTSQVQALTVIGMGGNSYADYAAGAVIAGTDRITFKFTISQTGGAAAIALWY